MISNGSVELSLLHLRINELERRLARLEGHQTGSGADTVEETTAASPAAPVDGSDTTSGGAGAAVELDAPRAGTAGLEPAHDGLEGARLIALEMLSLGYERHEVATYLHSTFGISDTEAVLDSAGLVSG